MNRLNYAGFTQYLTHPAFHGKGHRVAGISGGRTSALMAALLPADVSLLFQNTGKEHEQTLVFLDRLQDAIGRKITWLEFQKPPTTGAPPRLSSWKEVTFSTASRNGEPFVALLETLAEYRKEAKGLPPVVPHPRGRICTAYMKVRTSLAYTTSMWGDAAVVQYVGLRADEPARVARLRGERQNITAIAPLSGAGITKADVLRFWEQQAFDLQIPEWQGNCTGCFLKDQSDLARVLEDTKELTWWSDLEARFGRFAYSGQGYAELGKQSTPRALVREALHREEGLPSFSPEWGISPQRFALLVRDEQRRRVEQPAPFSCSCEGAETMGYDVEDALLEGKQ